MIHRFSIPHSIQHFHLSLSIFFLPFRISFSFDFLSLVIYYYRCLIKVVHKILFSQKREKCFFFQGFRQKEKWFQSSEDLISWTHFGSTLMHSNANEITQNESKFDQLFLLRRYEVTSFPKQMPWQYVCVCCVFIVRIKLPTKKCHVPAVYWIEARKIKLISSRIAWQQWL